MTEQGSIQMSQGYEILPPRSVTVYRIPCDEWTYLKQKIVKITHEPWVFHTVGSLLIGAGVTTLISILLGTFGLPAQSNSIVIAWAVVAISGISGLLCLIFAHKERQIKRERAGDVVAQMEIIEKRFERKSS